MSGSECSSCKFQSKAYDFETKELVGLAHCSISRRNSPDCIQYEKEKVVRDD